MAQGFNFNEKKKQIMKAIVEMAISPIEEHDFLCKIIFEFGLANKTAENYIDVLIGAKKLVRRENPTNKKKNIVKA
jgi:hypothetical protein